MTESGQSNQVKMWLKIPIAQLGPDFVMLDRVVPAELVMHVEGFDVRRQKVELIIEQQRIKLKNQ